MKREPPAVMWSGEAGGGAQGDPEECDEGPRDLLGADEIPLDRIQGKGYRQDQLS